MASLQAQHNMQIQQIEQYHQQRLQIELKNQYDDLYGRYSQHLQTELRLQEERLRMELKPQTIISHVDRFSDFETPLFVCEKRSDMYYVVRATWDTRVDLHASPDVVHAMCVAHPTRDSPWVILLHETKLTVLKPGPNAVYTHSYVDIQGINTPHGVAWCSAKSETVLVAVWGKEVAIIDVADQTPRQLYKCGTNFRCNVLSVHSLPHNRILIGGSQQQGNNPRLYIWQFNEPAAQLLREFKGPNILDIKPATPFGPDCVLVCSSDMSLGHYLDVFDVGIGSIRLSVPLNHAPKLGYCLQNMICAYDEKMTLSNVNLQGQVLGSNNSLPNSDRSVFVSDGSRLILAIVTNRRTIAFINPSVPIGMIPSIYMKGTVVCLSGALPQA
eukprot:TRINITY_DN3381_c0_g1_i2.p1 TRINITY_DN3381_c0_g1~~TRINITY_DN3381_c0_g1_i2.p1  ORF type:complete len:385 (+),score=60.82 TRINITY_DN3381_c0_g1_i2:546-1700(+)